MLCIASKEHMYCMVWHCAVCMEKGILSLADLFFSLMVSLTQRHKSKMVYMSEAIRPVKS